MSQSETESRSGLQGQSRPEATPAGQFGIHSWRRMARQSLAALWLIAVAWTCAGTAWGKVEDPFNPLQKVEEPKEYVLQYFVVLCVVGGGVAMVCRPTRRLDEPSAEHIVAGVDKANVKDI